MFRGVDGEVLIVLEFVAFSLSFISPNLPPESQNIQVKNE